MKNVFFLSIVALALLACGCSDRGPASVMVNIYATIGDEEFSEAGTLDKDWHRRFILEVYDYDNLSVPVARKVILFDGIDKTGKETRLPVSFSLNAKNYVLAVWSDLIPSKTTADYFYSASTLSDVTLTDSAENMSRRFATCARCDLNLNNCVPDESVFAIAVNLKSPLAPVRIVATDYTLFADMYGKDAISEATIRVNYTSEIPIAYSVMEAVPHRWVTGISSETRLSCMETLAEGALIASDFLFAADDISTTYVTVSVFGADNKLLHQTSNLELHYKKGLTSTLRGAFLTGGTGISIDTDFDEDIIIDLN